MALDEKISPRPCETCGAESKFFAEYKEEKRKFFCCNACQVVAHVGAAPKPGKEEGWNLAIMHGLWADHARRYEEERGEELENGAEAETKRELIGILGRDLPQTKLDELKKDVIKIQGELGKIKESEAFIHYIGKLIHRINTAAADERLLSAKEFVDIENEIIRKNPKISVLLKRKGPLGQQMKALQNAFLKMLNPPPSIGACLSDPKEEMIDTVLDAIRGHIEENLGAGKFSKVLGESSVYKKLYEHLCTKKRNAIVFLVMDDDFTKLQGKVDESMLQRHVVLGPAKMGEAAHVTEDPAFQIRMGFGEVELLETKSNEIIAVAKKYESSPVQDGEVYLIGFWLFSAAAAAAAAASLPKSATEQKKAWCPVPQPSPTLPVVPPLPEKKLGEGIVSLLQDFSEGRRPGPKKFASAVFADDNFLKTIIETYAEAGDLTLFAPSDEALEKTPLPKAKNSRRIVLERHTTPNTKMVQDKVYFAFKNTGTLSFKIEKATGNRLITLGDIDMNRSVSAKIIASYLVVVGPQQEAKIHVIDRALLTGTETVLGVIGALGEDERWPAAKIFIDRPAVRKQMEEYQSSETPFTVAIPAHAWSAKYLSEMPSDKLDALLLRHIVPKVSIPYSFTDNPFVQMQQKRYYVASVGLGDAIIVQLLDDETKLVVTAKVEKMIPRYDGLVYVVDRVLKFTGESK